jgi:RND family efflux transporter MFP subunit
MVNLHVAMPLCLCGDFSLNQEGGCMKRGFRFNIKFLRLGIGLGVLALLVSTVLQTRRDGLPVDMLRVDTGTIHTSISVAGTVQPGTQVKVTTGVTGRIIDLSVQEGQPVVAGDVLLRLDPTKAQAVVRRSEDELASAEADARAAGASLSFNEEKAARLEQLAARDLTAIEELQNARNQVQIHVARYAAAKERVQQRRAALDGAQEDVAQTVIRAPMAGTVVHVVVDAGETVTGSAYGPGTTVMHIADMTTMIVQASVDEIDIPDIRDGLPVEVRVDALPDTVLEGRVTRVARAAVANRQAGEQAPVAFPIEITLSRPPSAIRPGMSAQGHVIIASREDVVAVPIQAVQENTEGTYVFRIVDRHLIHRTLVTLGLSDDAQVEIRDGLETGDVIVTGSTRMLKVLKDGDEVSAQGAGM